MPSEDSIIVKTKVAPMYRKPTFKSEMVTQALIWEKLNILDKQDNWFKVKQWDDYVSWIHNSYITDTILSEKIIKEESGEKKFLGWFCNIRFKCGDDLVECEGHLALGSCVPMFQDENGFHFISPDGFREGTNIKNFLKKDEPICDYPEGILHSAGSECKVPYLWGGKSSYGYDCSGFVQTILKLYGINFPRDAYQQINRNKLIEVKYKNISIGDLLFFADNKTVNHVAI